MSENIKKDRVVSFRLSESEFAPFEKKLAA
ncbi:molybdopterin-guanine dinucleotide biosynthesis protein MobC, partial [Salmonella enterica]|nr:molybdopterin-guanine dinucleotide biosynthesis protein MobC [Salmonella enterica]